MNDRQDQGEQVRARAYEALCKHYRNLALGLISEVASIAEYSGSESEVRESLKDLGRVNKGVINARILSREQAAVIRTLEYCLGFVDKLE